MMELIFGLGMLTLIGAGFFYYCFSKLDDNSDD
jgi:hypothetical protein